MARYTKKDAKKKADKGESYYSRQKSKMIMDLKSQMVILQTEKTSLNDHLTSVSKQLTVD